MLKTTLKSPKRLQGELMFWDKSHGSFRNANFSSAELEAQIKIMSIKPATYVFTAQWSSWLVFFKTDNSTWYFQNIHILPFTYSARLLSECHILHFLWTDNSFHGLILASRSANTWALWRFTWFNTKLCLMGVIVPPNLPSWNDHVLEAWAGFPFTLFLPFLLICVSSSGGLLVEPFLALLGIEPERTWLSGSLDRLRNPIIITFWVNWSRCDLPRHVPSSIEIQLGRFDWFWNSPDRPRSLIIITFWESSEVYVVSGSNMSQVVSSFDWTSLICLAECCVHKTAFSSLLVASEQK